MALKVREIDCTHCRLCFEVCPMAAIRPPGGRNGTAAYSILPERCTECVGHYSWPRCAALCPAACIESDPARLEDHDALVRKWHALALATAFEASVPDALESVSEIGESGA